MLLRHSFLLFFLFLFLSSLVLAVPPFMDQTNLGGLQIEFPSFSSVPVNEDFNLSVHIYNISSGVAINTSTDCFLHVYRMGDHILILNQSSVEHIFDYEFEINNSVFNELGFYRVLVYCEHLGVIGGFVNHGFEVTIDGFPNDRYPVGWLVLIIAFGLVAGLSLWVSFSLKSSGLMGVKALMFLYGLANVFLIGMFSYFISVQPARVDLFSDVTSIFLYVNGMLLLLVILLYSVYLIKRAISRNGGGDDD
jgi:hypothetical protein